jgi:Superfamily II RNA helicase
MTLFDRLPGDPSPDALYDTFATWASEAGLELYPAQQEALIEIVSDSNVILSTPTGSGKSLVATGAHFAALARRAHLLHRADQGPGVGEVLRAVRDVRAGAVGMMTGDSSVNAHAPIICCTAEILANIALRDGADADVGQVVMDEFHFYSEPDRGWAWQVPLLELPRAQFLLMSATLGDVSFFEGPDPAHRPADRCRHLGAAAGPAHFSVRHHADPGHAH